MTEQELLAAEYSLGLLEGEALMEARRLAVIDEDFAAHAAWWSARFAPLVSSVAPVEPSAGIWARIERRLAGEPSATVHQLTRKVRFWQGLAGLAASAAAAATLFVLLPSPEPAAPPPAAAPARAPLLFASLAGETGTTSLSVAYLSQERDLVVTPGRIDQQAGRDHELWVIPADAAPISLGTISAQGVQRRRLEASVAARIVSGATIAISLEPAGGSPTGQPTGPVLATGPLSAV